jgi:hypothetical protein
MGFEIGQVVLAVLAAAALLKVVVPPLMHRMGLIRLRVLVDDDPSSAEPRGEDASYRERFEQFKALGFRPLGTTYETCWFISAYDWFRRSRPVRWMATPDGRTLGCFHRLIDEEPVRFSAVTILEGGEMVRTTCPGARSVSEWPLPENYHRVDLTGVDPADLLSRHQAEVSAFSGKRGRGVVAATLQQAIDVETACERYIVPRISQVNAEQVIKVTFGGPLLLMLALLYLARGTVSWVELAIAICVGAAIYEATVRFAVRGNFRTAVAASHAASSGPPPIAKTEQQGEEPMPAPVAGGMSSTARTVLLWVTMIITFVVTWQVLNHRR